jgi:hypothetical protein
MNTTKITNKIGLEAEFFVKKGNKLVYPGNYGFGTDEYIILGEFRSDPGETISQTVGNFLIKWYEINEQAKKKGVEICIDPYQIIDKKHHAEILRKMGTKEISTCSNLYSKDILEDTDIVIENGEITGYYLSIGLHIHFSSVVENLKERIITYPDSYIPVKLPIALFGATDPMAYLDLYRREKSSGKEEKILCAASCNRITKPVIRHIVKTMDEEVLKDYNITDVKLKYRQPGFYEVKSDGRFEYRSLPMSQRVLTYIYDITSTAFKLLEDL